jgi:hypothetical protein
MVDCGAGRSEKRVIPAVQSALNSILGNNPVLNNASGAGRAFELYIMTGIAVEMQSRNFDVWLQRSDGTRIYPGDPNQVFIQRGGSPTGVPAASAGANNASVIGMSRLGGAIWELWNGFQFKGRSGGLHEIAIGLVPGSVASDLRIAGGCPRGRPRVAIECKDHASVGLPDEMRAFVARLYDLSLLKSHGKYLPNSSATTMAIYPGSPSGSFYEAKQLYWDENRNSFNAIARRSGFSAGSRTMSSYYSIEPHSSISLNSTGFTTLIQAVCQWIDNNIP